MTLTDYELGLLYGILTIEQWRQLPDSLQRKLKQPPAPTDAPEPSSRDKIEGGK